VGLDGVERVTSLAFEPRPNHLDDATALFEMLLAPGQGARLVLRIGCDIRSRGIRSLVLSILRSAPRGVRSEMPVRVRPVSTARTRCSTKWHAARLQISTC
jgi:hypothetical protein